jgi:hypothetical protein
MDTLRKAITKYGSPTSLYMDNGSAFVAHTMSRTCGKLSINKIHTKPGIAKSKGKIEKFHQVVDSFLSELELDKVDNLAALNEKWSYYLEVFYQNEKHAGLLDDLTPVEAFSKDKKEIKYFDISVLHDSFLQVTSGRIVDKSGCVSFKGEKYTGKGLINLIGHKVDIVWEISDEKLMWAELKGLPKIELTKFIMPVQVPKRPKQADMHTETIDTKHIGSRILNAAEKCVKEQQILRMKGLYGPNWNKLDVGTNVKGTSSMQACTNENESKNQKSNDIAPDQVSYEKTKENVEKEEHAINFRQMKPSSSIINKTLDVSHERISFFLKKCNEDNSHKKGNK